MNFPIRGWLEYAHGMPILLLEVRTARVCAWDANRIAGDSAGFEDF
ncbi:unnamed protein product [marine sediment metagenome]|uniref:Uncharacterized protein n=1 Tax=marine sediment metagenome TaxID=412755 RepID=X0WZ88_9ZZZZ